MERDNNILLAASHYTRSYYLNPAYDALPRDVKYTLKAAASMAAEKARGVLTVGFRRGEIYAEVSREANDFDYDEIAARVAADQFAEEQGGLLVKVQTWRRLSGHTSPPTERYT